MKATAAIPTATVLRQEHDFFEANRAQLITNYFLLITIP